MERLVSIFDIFGGIRPMARAIEESPSKVMGWKRSGHIPSQRQADVLAKGQALGLPITAENVVFPLGCPDHGVDPSEQPVDCDPTSKLQPKDSGQ